MRSGVVGNSTRRGKLSSREFQGFAITDPYAPVVFVNSDDFKAAQTATRLSMNSRISGLVQLQFGILIPLCGGIPKLRLNYFAILWRWKRSYPQTEFEIAWRDKDIETVAGRLSRQF